MSFIDDDDAVFQVHVHAVADGGVKDIVVRTQNNLEKMRRAEDAHDKGTQISCVEVRSVDIHVWR